MKKLNILLIILLLSIPLISAKLVFQKDTNVELRIPCSHNGTFCDTTTTCEITIVYPNQSLMLDNESMTNLGNGMPNITLLDSSIVGNYDAHMTCCRVGDCASNSFIFSVTNSGEEIPVSNIIIVIAFLIIAIILVAIGYSFDYWIIKASFYLLALFMSLLAIRSGALIASGSSGLLSMSTTGLILIIAIISVTLLYLFIHWMVEIFKQLKQKEKIKWDF